MLVGHNIGAALRHAAIVARELGIPAVMSVPGITSVPDGTWLGSGRQHRHRSGPLTRSQI